MPNAKLHCPFRELKRPKARLAASDVAEQMLADPLLSTRTRLFVHLYSASIIDIPKATVERIRSIPKAQGHGSTSTSMGIINGGLALASTCWSAILWKLVVDAAGEEVRTAPCVTSCIWSIPCCGTFRETNLRPPRPRGHPSDTLVQALW